MKISQIVSSFTAVVAALVFLGMPTFAQQQTATATTSSSVTTSTPLVCPTSLSAVVNGDTSITVSSPAPTGGTAPYQYAFDISTDGMSWTLGSYGSASSTTFTGLTPGTKYYFTARWQDASGQTVSFTQAGLASSITATTATALNAGTLTPSNVQATSLTLTASGASGGIAPYTYTFYQAPDNAGSPGTWTVLGSPQTSNVYNVSGLTANTKYWFKVVVTDSGN